MPCTRKEDEANRPRLGLGGGQDGDPEETRMGSYELAGMRVFFWPSPFLQDND